MADTLIARGNHYQAHRTEEGIRISTVQPTLGAIVIRNSQFGDSLYANLLAANQNPDQIDTILGDVVQASEED
jgi:hypothetical protein